MNIDAGNKIIPGTLVKSADYAYIGEAADLIGLVLDKYELSDNDAYAVGDPAYIDVMWRDGAIYVTLVNDVVLITHHTQCS